MKKQSEVTLHDPKTKEPKVYELHTEKPKGKKEPVWYIKDTAEDEILNKDAPFSSRPTLQDIFKVVGQ